MKKRLFALVLAACLILSLVPAPAFAEEDPTKTESVQALIDALPDTVTAENREAVEAQLTAIDDARLLLLQEDLDALDFTRYDAAVAAICALDGQPGVEIPEALAEGDGKADAEAVSLTINMGRNSNLVFDQNLLLDSTFPADMGSFTCKSDSSTMPAGLSVAFYGLSMAIEADPLPGESETLTFSYILESDTYKDRTVTVTLRFTEKTTQSLAITMPDWVCGTSLGSPSGYTLPPVYYNFKTTYAKQDGTPLAVAPSEEGGYVVTVSYEDNDTLYTGSANYSILSATAHALDKTLQELLDEGGTVKLVKDYDITQALNIDRDVTLDLNGHVIKMDGSDRVMQISGGTTTLLDSDPSAAHSDAYTDLPSGGVITGGNAKFGGGIHICGGSLVMEGGTIANCSTKDSSSGGGIYVSSGSLVMEGGTILNCSAPTSGGGGIGVGDKCSFTMKKGTIRGCSAYGGGGVYGYPSSTLIMEDGVIADCSASNGAGVYAAKTFTMKGGTIQNCSGSAVYCHNNSTFTMTGGDIKAAEGARALQLQQATMYADGGSVNGDVFISAGRNPGTIDRHSDASGYTTFIGTINSRGEIKDTAKLTVTFDPRNGKTGTTAKVLKGQKVAKPAPDPTREAHRFDGWHTEEACTTAYDFTQAVTDHITLYAKWLSNTYTITYKPGENGTGTEATTTSSWEEDATLKDAIFTRTGYTQTGWATTDGGETAYALNATCKERKDLTLYPVWTANSYTLAFDTKGGSEVAPITQAYGTAVTAPADPTRDGYAFAGWEPEVPATMPAEDLTISAKWTANSHTLTFDTKGGSKITPITQPHGTTVTAPADPTRDGYTFAGWEPDIPTTMPAEDLTISAKWTANSYTLTFDTKGGSEIAPITQAYGTAVTAPADPTRDGYTFAGWEPEVPTTMPAENLTISAKWTIQAPKTYTITYKPGENGTGAETEATRKADENTDLRGAIFTRTGYTQTGWATTDGGKKVYDLNALYEEKADVTLYPVWTANSYTLTFDAKGGSQVKPITQAYDTTVLAPAEPTRSGYSFIGWEPKIPATMPAENMTFTALWAKNVTRVDLNLSGHGFDRRVELVKVTSQDDIAFPDTTYDGGWAITKDQKKQNTLSGKLFKADTQYYLWVKFTAKEGYALDGLTAKDVYLDGTAALSLTENEGTVTVLFRLPVIYTIKVTVGKNGSVDADDLVPVFEGEDVTIKITPNEGYVVYRLEVDGANETTTRTYTFKNVQESHTFKVRFLKNGSNAKTGDRFPLIPALATVALSAAGLAALVIIGKKKLKK